jgi:hypothetical protein
MLHEQVAGWTLLAFGSSEQRFSLTSLLQMARHGFAILRRRASLRRDLPPVCSATNKLLYLMRSQAAEAR